MPALQAVEVSLRQLVSSKSLLSSPPTVVLPGVAFPAVGPVGLSSPLSRFVDTSPRTLGTRLHDDCQSPLSHRFTWRWRCHTWPASALCMPLPARGRLEAARPRQGSCSPGTPRLPAIRDQETTGSPTFPSDPRDDMPRSQTPVVSCALALAHPGLRPSGACKPSAFPALLLQVSLRTTTIPISGLYHAAYHLAPPRSAPPLPA